MSANDPADQDATPTARFELEELARLTASASDADVDLDEWDDGVVAAGTPLVNDPPLMSRTSTIHDPLTTALLAEASRHDLAPVADAATSPVTASDDPDTSSTRWAAITDLATD